MSKKKETTYGYWYLSFTGVDELNDTDQEHIAKLIKEGFTSGEVIQDDYDDDDETV